MKNPLIDSLDRLLSAAEGQERWHAAEALSRDLGMKSILVAEVDGRAGDISWISTSMPDSWMEEYISEDYVSVDPLVTRLAEKLGTETLEAGSLGRSDAASQKAWSHNHGLKAAGFGGLHCTRFGNPQAAGKYVTLGYDHSLDQASRHTPVSMQLFSALLAATVGRGDAPADQTYPAAPSALTQRQREVLSCLAEGMMTARIAETLGISEAAVSLHFSNARKALGANTREHALALAMKHGLISL